MSQDKIKELFREIKMVEPSGDFMRNLMIRVEKESLLQKRKKQFLGYLSIFGGIAATVGIPAIIFYFMKIDISLGNLSFKFPDTISVFKGISIDPMIIVCAMVILGLLIGDSLLRSKHDQKKYKNSHA